MVFLASDNFETDASYTNTTSAHDSTKTSFWNQWNGGPASDDLGPRYFNYPAVFPPVDLNYCFEDGSVKTYHNISPGDSRFTQIPYRMNGQNAWRYYMPNE